MPACPVNQRRPFTVEGGGIEIGVGALARQRPGLDLLGRRIDAHDGVETAIGDPGRAVRPDDYAMRRRARPERDALDLPRFGIEPAEHPGALAGVPDGAVRCRRHVVGMIAGGQIEIFDLGRRGGLGHEQQRHT